MIKCPRCGYDNPDHALYCARCGYPLTTQPPYYQQPNKRSLRKIIIPVIAIVVVVIAVIAALPFVLHSGPSSAELITPSKAASVVGGPWSVDSTNTYSFTISNDVVTEKLLNGSTETISLNSFYSTMGGEPLPGVTSGYVEYLNGNVSGEQGQIMAMYIVFSSSTNAKNFFSQSEATLQISSSNFNKISNNEFVAYTPGGLFGEEYDSIILVLNGNSVKIVSVTAPNPLGTSQLESLVNSF
ncbi:zinc-ribbon domain-containing protein [Sulfurisphaera ohwakuensis]|uniref:Ribosomal protein L37E n=1 Tax=Sulfurisphaera ohwakuensis TaxID=69656 RepID=A0A650CKH7_SULOH|nr:zinc-ribbon domain-containing protein [Sulfurisphaera ohwakuensis]MBB5255271.1 ribosomal protein L37E [Sulfurisphaera ohwakuensis]QGR18223.1 zinc-ribbon domain-containing protein [Sulfurisphaera ohwakuensis]